MPVKKLKNLVIERIIKVKTYYILNNKYRYHISNEAAVFLPLAV